MSIQTRYPVARPLQIYNIINGRDELPLNTTFSRNSIATYYASSGLIEQVGANTPRFNHDPITKEFKGLELESSAKNSLYYSDMVTNFGNAGGWNISGGGSQIGPVINDTPGGSTVANQAINVQYNGIEGSSAASNTSNIQPLNQGSYTLSVYAKVAPGNTTIKGIFLRVYDSNNLIKGATFNLDTGAPISSSNTQALGSEFVGNGWWRCWMTFTASSGLNHGFQFYITNSGGASNINVPGAIGEGVYMWGAQLESDELSSYIPNGAVFITRPDEEFSITTDVNYDNGVSLLVDTETTTEDYIYEVKDSGNSSICKLSVEQGILTWDINGTTTTGSYPEVGLAPGRFRTMSTLGLAGVAGDNWLYTPGLSISLNATPAADARSITFGLPQTLKAIYTWTGQLNAVNSVSLIKGLLNIVPNIPIQADAFTFVLDNDPTGIGNTDVNLQGIVPNTVMTVTWGDGISNTYSKGTVPTHTYPYPGLYQVQIMSPSNGADNSSIDQINFSNSQVNSGFLLRGIQAWPPQYRVGATGPGFTGTQLNNILKSSTQITEIEPFKYSNLTVTYAAFADCGSMNSPTNTWDWIPYELPDATDIGGMFSNLTRYHTGTDPRGTVLPQLETGTALTHASSVWSGTFNTAWQDDSGNTPVVPITNTDNVIDLSLCFAFYQGSTIPLFNTSNVVNWSSTFSQSRLTGLPAFDFSSGENFDYLIYNNNVFSDKASIGSKNFSNATSMVATFRDCYALTGAFPAIATSKVTNMTETWRGSNGITSMPPESGINMDLGQVETLTRAWMNCTGLTGAFPLYSLGNVEIAKSTWQGCGNITSFPQFDFSKYNNIVNMMESCNSVTTLPQYDFSSVINAGAAFRGMSALTTVDPNNDMPNATGIANLHQDNLVLTTCPAYSVGNAAGLSNMFYNCQALDFNSIGFTVQPTNATSFSDCWFNNQALTTMPVTSYTKGTSFNGTWKSCSNLANFAGNQFNTTGVLVPDSFVEAFQDCALTNASIFNILDSLITNGATGVTLDIDGGTNATPTGNSADAVQVLTTAIGTPVSNTTYPANLGLTGRGWVINAN